MICNIELGKSTSAFGFDIPVAKYVREERKTYGFFSAQRETKVTAFFHFDKKVWMEQNNREICPPNEQVALTVAAMSNNITLE